MFFNSNDPRTQLQARLNCEGLAQRDQDRSCDDTDFSNATGTTGPGSNGTDATNHSTRPLFRSGTQDPAATGSKRLVRPPSH
jgi:hypothetical protein